ncbi:MAG: hypothetical protein FJ303_25315 [Planctomycetes bacterium]|nr:hypothetical protein [Planctomycetota bacterium]
MFRLAVISTQTARWQAVAARLRDVAIDVAPPTDSLPDGDAVLLETLTAPIIERCLHAGKRVIALAYGELQTHTIRRLRDIAAQGKTHWSIVNPDRHLPSRQLIRQQLDAGKLGEPGLLRIHRWGDPDAGVRDLDLALWYFGKQPDVVFAIERPGVRQVHLGFPGGGMALIDYVAKLPGDSRYHYLSLIGSSGAAYADDHRNMQLAFTRDGPRPLPSDEGIGPWCSLVREFVSGSDGVDAWLTALAVNDAVLESLRSGQAYKSMITKP